MLHQLFTHASKVGAQALTGNKNLDGQKNLAQAPTGQQVTITGFAQLTPQYQQHLEAYGLLPGRSLQVLAQRPLTIVLVEQTELAFETEIATRVLVKQQT